MKAKLKYLRVSPRKVRLVADAIRGKSTGHAEKELLFASKKSAGPVLKLLRSAISNASHNNKKDANNLFVKEIRVDEGPILKRHMPRARGRATMIRKRTSHIQIVLEEQFEKNSKLKMQKSK